MWGGGASGHRGACGRLRGRGASDRHGIDGVLLEVEVIPSVRVHSNLPFAALLACRPPVLSAVRREETSPGSSASPARKTALGSEGRGAEGLTWAAIGRLKRERRERRGIPGSTGGTATLDSPGTETGGVSPILGRWTRRRAASPIRTRARAAKLQVPFLAASPFFTSPPVRSSPPKAPRRRAPSTVPSLFHGAFLFCLSSSRGL